MGLRAARALSLPDETRKRGNKRAAEGDLERVGRSYEGGTSP